MAGVTAKVTALAQAVGADIKALLATVALKASVSSTAPASLAAAASPGSSTAASRADHVHPYPTALGAVTFSGAVTVSNVASQITLVRASGIQYATIEDNDNAGALKLTSYSATGNAKTIIYDSRTDAAGSAVTAGALGHTFLINGSSQFILNSSGASLSGNFNASGYATFGSSVSVSGQLTVTNAAVVVVNNGATSGAAASQIGGAAKNTVSLLLGTGSMVGAATTDAGGVLRFNGAGVTWGDLSYYPTASLTSGGQFRLSTSATTFNSTPNASLGVGSLYSAGRSLFGPVGDNGVDMIQSAGRIFSNVGIGINSGYDALPALTSSLIAGEITGNANAYAGSYTGDYGFLRLSAGGGTTLIQKTAIDIQGYGTTDGSQIRFYTSGAERARLKSGRLLIGTTTDNGADRVQIAGSLSATGRATVGGPLSIGTYTLSTLPSAAAYSGCYLTVSDASGGPKLCYSSGSAWNMVNTTTAVS